MMASKVLKARQKWWLAAIQEGVVVSLFACGYHFAGFGIGIMSGYLTYRFLGFLLRSFLAKDHTKGLKFLKQKKFEEAIPFFEKSVEFFSKNNWVDKYRFLTLLSPSEMPFKEVGLCNIALCYNQTGNGQKAMDYYKQALDENAENGFAKEALKMLRSLGNTNQESC